MVGPDVFRAFTSGRLCYGDWMRLSKRGEYALRALIDFGIAADLGRPLIRVSELAEKERLPLKFLEQILMQLKTHGYLETKRGAHGGYKLKRPMEEIRFGDVIRLIDGPLAPIGCVSMSAYEKCSCPDEEHCGLRMLMADVRNAIAGILDKYTLAQVVEITLRRMRKDEVPIPFMVEEFFPHTAGERPGPRSGKRRRQVNLPPGGTPPPSDAGDSPLQSSGNYQSSP